MAGVDLSSLLASVTAIPSASDSSSTGGTDPTSAVSGSGGTTGVNPWGIGMMPEDTASGLQDKLSDTMTTTNDLWSQAMNGAQNNSAAIVNIGNEKNVVNLQDAGARATAAYIATQAAYNTQQVVQKQFADSGLETNTASTLKAMNDANDRLSNTYQQAENSQQVLNDGILGVLKGQHSLGDLFNAAVVNNPRGLLKLAAIQQGEIDAGANTIQKEQAIFTGEVQTDLAVASKLNAHSADNAATAVSTSSQIAALNAQQQALASQSQNLIAIAQGSTQNANSNIEATKAATQIDNLAVRANKGEVNQTDLSSANLGSLVLTGQGNLTPQNIKQLTVTPGGRDFLNKVFTAGNIFKNAAGTGNPPINPFGSPGDAASLFRATPGYTPQLGSEAAWKYLSDIFDKTATDVSGRVLKPNEHATATDAAVVSDIQNNVKPNTDASAAYGYKQISTALVGKILSNDPSQKPFISKVLQHLIAAKVPIPAEQLISAVAGSDLPLEQQVHAIVGYYNAASKAIDATSMPSVLGLPPASTIPQTAKLRRPGLGGDLLGSTDSIKLQDETSVRNYLFRRRQKTDALSGFTDMTGMGE